MNWKKERTAKMNEQNELDFLDKLAIITSFIQFQTLGDTNAIQKHLEQIEDKLDWIITRLGEK